jgi:uncharacterized membrane protein YbaN (DUF454 family)
MAKVWRLIIAIFFLVVGVAGLVLPIIPGIAFILVGLLALSTVYAPAGKIFEWLEDRHPEVHKHVAHWQNKLFPEVKQKGPLDVPEEP